MRAPARFRGFSLIEVLVALTLLVLVLTPLLEVLSQGLRAVGGGDAQVRAVAIAQARLAELEAGGIGAGAPAAGETDAGERIYRWEIRVEPWPGDEHGEIDAAVITPWLATAEVSWDDGARTTAVSLSTLLLEAVR